MKFNFNAVSGKIVSMAEFKQKYAVLKKNNMTFPEKTALAITKPLALVAGFGESLRIVFSETAKAAYRKTANDGTLGLYKDEASNERYIKSDTIELMMARISERHPVLTKPEKLQEKVNDLTLKALHECQDHSTRKLKPSV